MCLRMGGSDYRLFIYFLTHSPLSEVFKEVKGEKIPHSHLEHFVGFLSGRIEIPLVSMAALI